MRAIHVALTGLVLAGGSLVAALDDCAAGANDVFTKQACCLTAGRRRHLFSRNDQCSNGNPCCIAKAKGPPKISTDDGTGTRTINLQCGRNFDPGSDPQDVNNGVTYAIEPCPDALYPGQTCFHTKATPGPGETIQDIHLAILDGSADPGDPNTLPTGLGKWPHNSYCYKDGNCWVPISVVQAVLVPPSGSLCDQDIIVVFSIDLGTATCFAQGDVIQGNQGRWFMFTRVSFTCPDICTQSCCCPPPTPPQVHTCHLGTAFGYGTQPQAINFNGDLPSTTCKRWGWYFIVPSGQLTGGISGNLIVGAGGNDLSHGTIVGTWTAKVTGTSLAVSYSLSSGFDFTEIHIYASCASPDKCAPGSYGFPVPLPDLSGPTDTSFQTSITIDPACQPNYFLIFHAAINQVLPLATPCPPEVS